MEKKRKPIVAEWLDDNTKQSTFKCSYCGGEPMLSVANNNLAYYCLSGYCPHCGRKMKYNGEMLGIDYKSMVDELVEELKDK